MAMRDIFTGGACNINGDSSQQRNQNPFNQFLDNLVMGNAQNRNQLQGFMEGDQQGDLVENALIQKQQMMQLMNREFDQLNTNFSNQLTMEHHFMEQQQQQRVKEQIMHAEFEKQREFQIQHQNQIAHMFEQQMNEQQQQQQAEIFARELAMQQGYEQAEMQIDQQEQNNIIKQNADQMFVKMAADDSPRFKNSKFLGFLNQLRTGELKIEGDQLVQGEPDQNTKDLEKSKNIYQSLNPKKFKNNKKVFENAWDEANQEEQKQQHQQLPELDEFWAQKINEYEKERENDDEFTQKLEKEYQEVLKHMNEQGNYNDLDDAWQKASDLQEQTLYKDASDVYNFAQNNPYLNHINPMHLALEFMANGKPFDAILALESHLQKSQQNPNNANAWRIMGRLHQENDNDQKAVACLLNALKTDNKNPDIFLALGISCTNILDEVKAMNFLKQWYMISPLQNEMPIQEQLILSNKEYEDYTIEEIKFMNQKMLEIFEKASFIHPQNADLHVSLAVLQYISRNYESSIHSFKNALNFDQNSYSLWNKLGATLAQLGKADEAIDAYHRALELKPNYVRVWVNLGIAHAYKGDYIEAARLYLNALSFNPEAKHLWSYLQTCFMCMQRFDLVGKISECNPLLFGDEFEILGLEELPQPEVEYNTLNNKYLFDNKINEWVNEFNNNNS